MYPNRWSILVIIILSSFGISTLAARPIEFSEVSLLVRAHESEADIMRQVRERKLIRSLSTQQEDLLRKQGASDALIRGLRDSKFTLSPSEANALAAEQELANKNHAPISARHDERESLGETVHLVSVSFGQPVNLSRWGGPDCQISFQCRRIAGEDIVEPALVDSARGGIDTTTYLGQGRAEDSTTIFDQRNYVSVTSRVFSRPIAIDTNNPVAIKGLPYVLYPIYAARGVCLYYIGRNGDGVKLAAVTSRS